MTERPGPSREQSPSNRLNRVFTRLVKAYDAKLTPDHLQPRSEEQRFLHFTTTEHDQSIFIEQHPYPEIYVMAPRTIRLLGTRLSLPVGEYGEDWAKKIAISAQKMREAATSPESDITIAEEARTAVEGNEELFKHHTFQGNQHRNDLAEGVQQTFYEAGEAEAHTAAFLTQYKVAGYEDPEQLYRDLIRDGVVSHFSLTVPPTVSAEMANQWVVLAPPVVEVGENRRLRLRSSFMEHWHRHREEYPRSAGTEALERPGCPVGRNLPGEQFSGVDISARQLAEYIKGERIRIPERRPPYEREETVDTRREQNLGPETSALTTPLIHVDVPVEKANSAHTTDTQDVLEFGSVAQPEQEEVLESNRGTVGYDETTEVSTQEPSIVFENGDRDVSSLDEIGQDQENDRYR